MYQRQWQFSSGLLNRTSAVIVSLVAISSLAVIVAFAQVRVNSSAAIASEELSKHIKYLASDQLQGRRSGTPGCQQAGEYIATQFKQYNLKPIKVDNYLQPFEFIAGIKFGDHNSLQLESNGRVAEFRIGEDYAPLNFSSNGMVSGEVVLAGYGISAPQINYDDYAQLDVRDKVVAVLPFSPEGNNVNGRFGQYLALRRKVLTARERGARAILFISEADNLKEAPGRGDDNYADAGLVAIRISKRTANTIFQGAGKTVEALLQSGSTGTPTGFALAKTVISLRADLTREAKTTENVLGWLEGNDERLKSEFVVIGAHYDHLGLGGSDSLAVGREGIHHGADDNASGVAGLLELARVFSLNRNFLRRSIVFAAFSGEEEGLLGSNYYVKQPPFPIERTVAMLNMDMIGRMKNDTLVISGVGTSTQWKPMIEELNRARGFTLRLQDDGFGPSDHASFYGKDVPVLHFFTGVHDDYHKPSDTYDLINVISQQAIVSLIQDIATRVISQDARLEFVRAQGGGERRAMNSGFRVYVGSVPDYAESPDGVKLSGVRPDSPAQKAGLKAGDVIVQLAGKNIRNVYDYTYVLQEMKPDQTVEVVVLRDGQRVTMKLTPTARQ
ncbi:MAG: M28 family peptidase [Acidobacteriota bacterium]